MGAATVDTIALVEHSESNPVPLADDELAGLQALIPGLSVKAQGGGLFVLNPGGVAGIGRIGNRPVQVSPKMAIPQLMFLVSYARDPFNWSSKLTDVSQLPDLFESVAALFAGSVSRATARGVMKGYQEYEEALATVRGRIDFSKMVKDRYSLFPPVDCRFDEYTEDIEMNRILKAATRILLEMARIGTSAAAGLRELLLRFAWVSDVRYSSLLVPEVEYTRLTEHYKPAVELARLILMRSSLDAKVGHVEVEGFFLDVASVFEDFVVVALRESLGLDENSFPQGVKGQLKLDRLGKIGLEPDLSWWEAGDCVFVGDVKYKVTPPTAGVKSPDLYQLLAYAQAANLDTGLLVYAKGAADESAYEIVHSKKLLRVRTLDLEQRPEGILADIDDIAADISNSRNVPQDQLEESAPTELLAVS